MIDLSTGVVAHDRVIFAIGERVGAEDARYIGGGKDIGANKSADCGGRNIGCLSSKAPNLVIMNSYQRKFNVFFAGFNLSTS